MDQNMFQWLVLESGFEDYFTKEEGKRSDIEPDFLIFQKIPAEMCGMTDVEEKKKKNISGK